MEMSKTGAHLVQTIRNAYASTNVTTAAWVELDSSLNSRVSHIEIADTSGQTMKLGIGASGSESDLIHIIPGGNGKLPLPLPEGVRLSVRAVSANATTGELVLNLYI